MKSNREMKRIVVFYLVSCCALASKTKDVNSAPPLSFPEDADGNILPSGVGPAEEEPSIASYLPDVGPGDSSSQPGGADPELLSPDASFALAGGTLPEAEASQQQEQSSPVQLVAQQPASANEDLQDPQTVQLMQEPFSTFKQSVEAQRQTALPPVSAALSFRARLKSEARQKRIMAKLKADKLTVRPGAGTGAPDTVKFGLFGKTFFGTSLKNNNFDLDVIMVLKWTDARAIDMVPAGLDKVTVGGDMAKKMVWMPEVVITNRAIKSVDIISTVVVISRTGEVTKVERTLVSCNNIFLLEDYPFDTQKLHVKIASSKYMLQELVMKEDEDKAISGVNDVLFDAFQYELDGWKVFAFDEKDGAMQKSRGVLEIRARRTMDKYAESHLMPTFLLLSISWAVFWFPFQNPFITPRLALSIIVLIAFTNLLIKSNEALPGGAPCNWNDIFNQAILSLMTSTIIINILTEIYKHSMKLDDLAQIINHEAKVVQPVLSIALISMILTGGQYKWISINTAQVLSKVMFMLAFAAYVSHSVMRMHVHKAEKDRKDREAAEQKRLAEEAKGFMMPPSGP